MLVGMLDSDLDSDLVSDLDSGLLVSSGQREKVLSSFCKVSMYILRSDGGVSTREAWRTVKSVVVVGGREWSV